MAVLWTQEVYDQAYVRSNGTPSYRRAEHGQDTHAFRSRLFQLSTQLPNFNPGTNVLIVGCGFGWTIEVAIDEFGHNRIWGVDTSSWIQTSKFTHSRGDVAPLILNVPLTVTALRSAGAGQQGRFDWVITELVVESLDPATELQPFLDECEGILRPNGNVGHIFAGKLTDPGEGDVHDRSLGLQWRTLAEWVAERPSHYWLNVHQWQLGGGV